MPKRSKLHYAKASDEKRPTAQTSIEQSFYRGIEYDPKSRKHKEIKTAITKYICKDMVSVYTVEKTGFRELVKTLNPGYNMPSRKDNGLADGPSVTALHEPDYTSHQGRLDAV